MESFSYKHDIKEEYLERRRERTAIAKARYKPTLIDIGVVAGMIFICLLAILPFLESLLLTI